MKMLHLQYSEPSKYNVNYIKPTCYAIEGDYSDPAVANSIFLPYNGNKVINLPV